MSTFEERTEQRLTLIEQSLHNIEERTASLPALINRVLELMGDFRHHYHTTGEAIVPDHEGDE